MIRTITVFGYKITRKVLYGINGWMDRFRCLIIFSGNNVKYKEIITNGVPFVSVARRGKCNIGSHFSMNNNYGGNPIGRARKCLIIVDNEAELFIGNNVGISGTALVAHKRIIIGNNVKIGGGVCIYDTDFHSLNFEFRADPEKDKAFTNKSDVQIEDNVFIGAHSTILKGVHIGENSIIGACSVVTKSVPKNEIWAGNPARFIKKSPQNVNS